MKSTDVRSKYISFFTARGHTEIPSAPLVPENDPSTLFTSSGMQPLIPYLLGQPHPSGKRLVDSQKSFRSQDIEEVGDNSHTTFFEMLGNWSLGDYFKKEQLSWIWEFLTKELGLPKEKLYVTVFEGNKLVPRDEESASIWKRIGVSDNHIYYYGVEKNWWSRSGEPDKMPPGEPGGPDSEVFYDFGTSHDPKFGKACHPNCQCGRFMEIANSVFMEYQKENDRSLKELPQKNVDFGGGLERLVAATNNDPDLFHIDFFHNAGALLEGNKKSVRIILDHVRAAMFIIDAGVTPGNKTQGYILRRLIRRAAMHTKLAKLDLLSNMKAFLLALAQPYKGVYDLDIQFAHVCISEEFGKFETNLNRGMKLLGQVDAFDLFQTYGFPAEIIAELYAQKGLALDTEDFNKKFEIHQEKSRTAAKGLFKGGLADHSVDTTRLHTAHHLLLAALQKQVDPTIRQRGSNITAQRLRMDVNFSRKITPEELKKVESLVNQKITEDLPVTRVEMAREEAVRIGAQMEFGHKYPEKVSVYFVGDRDGFFSAEFCGGPHVARTGEIGTFKITKEESAGSGIRRIYAVVSK